MAELKKVLKHCDPEWRSMTLLGFYGGGIRLGDVARLTWRNVDLDGGELSYQSQKTGRQTNVPFCEALNGHFLEIAGVDDPDAPLHPRAFETPQRQNGRTRNLSNQFRDILAAAGLIKSRTHEKIESKDGRAARRTVSEISFHSLRHTATSLLKQAGVGQAVAMDIVGHDSPEISRAYTHIDSDTKRAALEKQPPILD